MWRLFRGIKDGGLVDVNLLIEILEIGESVFVFIDFDYGVEIRFEWLNFN